jgi:hypothetical protein
MKYAVEKFHDDGYRCSNSINILRQQFEKNEVRTARPGVGHVIPGVVLCYGAKHDTFVL